MTCTADTPNEFEPYEVSYRIEYYGWCVHKRETMLGSVKVAGPFRDRARAEAEANYRLGRSILQT